VRELATPSSTGDGGTGERSLGLGDDGATVAWRARPVDRPTADAADAGSGLIGISMSESKRDDVRRTSPWTNHALAFAQPGTRLPFRGATSSAGRSGCCAVLRVLVAGGALRGGGGWCWGSLGGRVALACGWLARLEVVSGPGTCGWAAFAGWTNFFGFPEDFAAPSAATFHIRAAQRAKTGTLWHGSEHRQKRVLQRPISSRTLQRVSLRQVRSLPAPSTASDALKRLRRSERETVSQKRLLPMFPRPPATARACPAS